MLKKSLLDKYNCETLNGLNILENKSQPKLCIETKTCNVSHQPIAKKDVVTTTNQQIALLNLLNSTVLRSTGGQENNILTNCDPITMSQLILGRNFDPLQLSHQESILSKFYNLKTTAKTTQVAYSPENKMKSMNDVNSSNMLITSSPKKLSNMTSGHHQLIVNGTGYSDKLKQLANEVNSEKSQKYSYLDSLKTESN